MSVDYDGKLSVELNLQRIVASLSGGVFRGVTWGSENPKNFVL